MWVSPTKSFKELGGAVNVKPPPAKMADWTRQLARPRCSTT